MTQSPDHSIIADNLPARALSLMLEEELYAGKKEVVGPEEIVWAQVR